MRVAHEQGLASRLPALEDVHVRVGQSAFEAGRELAQPMDRGDPGPFDDGHVEVPLADEGQAAPDDQAQHGGGQGRFVDGVSDHAALAHFHRSSLRSKGTITRR